MADGLHVFFMNIRGLMTHRIYLVIITITRAAFKISNILSSTSDCIDVHNTKEHSFLNMLLKSASAVQIHKTLQ